MKKNFAIIGCGGYIAPRHLQAIKDTGNVVVAAMDKSDSVGILDKYFDDVHFFTEFERFDRHAEKLRRQGEGKKIDFVSICSPNYLHDAHVRFAFRIGADAICEKPLVLNHWNLDALEKLERETGRKVFSILQLRCHPSIIKLKEKIDGKINEKKHEVELTYITPRGKWYHSSWKGDVSKSGGLAANLGIHFFDILIWIFGKVHDVEVHHADNSRVSGYLELEKARVKWFLSLEKDDLPESVKLEGKHPAYRSILIDGEELEFSDVFSDLHTEVYKKTLDGKGFRISDSKPSIELVQKIRELEPTVVDEKKVHRFLRKGITSETKEYFAHPTSEVKGEVGKGTKIWHFSHLMSGSKIGENCVIGQNVFVGENVKIGSRCKIQNNVSVYSGVELEDDVFCGPSMVFTNVLNPRAFVERKNEFTKVTVKKGATIGANATIVGNLTIGRWALVGAGAVVTRDVPDYALVLGIPARQNGWVCKCGEVLTKQVSSVSENILGCRRCGEKYRHFLNRISQVGGNEDGIL